MRAPLHPRPRPRPAGRWPADSGRTSCLLPMLPLDLCVLEGWPHLFFSRWFEEHAHRSTSNQGKYRMLWGYSDYAPEFPGMKLPGKSWKCNLSWWELQDLLYLECPSFMLALPLVAIISSVHVNESVFLALSHMETPCTWCKHRHSSLHSSVSSCLRVFL